VNRALAVTPSKSHGMDFADVTKICSEYTITGLHNMTAVANDPFRFVYTSGVTVERDQSKSLPFLAEYRLMRVSILLRSCSVRLNFEFRAVSRMLSWPLPDNTSLPFRSRSLSLGALRAPGTPRVTQQRVSLHNLGTHLGSTCQS
jgi:hypothetical protein